ncbi:hypothetical protein QN219_04960 [Sinorhizobium sp. 7-81]|uniref:hypothetical protein n=1 Tax=Sinorhizobium sp. 8-89 TaxID=3049089 RepID=UPI0024C25AE2|nr:hypothetical protein [Sinorhizobium sp. 8-89]MDK1489406.1 hypothetical protein [Sinorhizobium sp. 8-89]
MDQQYFISPATRERLEALPRRLLPRRDPKLAYARWKFKVGDLVKFHGLVAVVKERHKSRVGHQHYEIEVIRGNCGDRPYRVARAEFLKAAHDEDQGQARVHPAAIPLAERPVLLLRPAHDNQLQLA